MDLNTLIQNPMVMFALMGLAAGWLASQIVGGGRGSIISYLVTGVLGAFVGGYLQRYLQLDLMKIGNPLVEQLVMATLGAMVVTFVANLIAREQR